MSGWGSLGLGSIPSTPTQNMEEQRPKVGIGTMILRDGKVLLAKRKGAHGAGEWAFPGGHLEYGESFKECASRETREETNIEIKNIKFQFLANVKKYKNKHYVHIGLVADYKSGKAKVMESDKSDDWFWFDLRNLPKPMFEESRLAFESYKTKKIYFD